MVCMSDDATSPARRSPAKTVILTQPVGWRVASAASGGLTGVIGILLIVLDPSLWILGLVFVAIGVFWAVRFARNSAVVDGDRLHLRGIFFSRTLERSSITSVDRFPFIDWNDAKGISHQSSVSAFLGNNSPAQDRRRAEAAQTLHAWLVADR